MLNMTENKLKDQKKESLEITIMPRTYCIAQYPVIIYKGKESEKIFIYK